MTLSEIEILYAHKTHSSEDVSVVVHLLNGLTPCPTMKMKLKDGNPESEWEVTGYGMVPIESLNADPPVLMLGLKNLNTSSEPLMTGQRLIEVR